MKDFIFTCPLCGYTFEQNGPPVCTPTCECTGDWEFMKRVFPKGNINIDGTSRGVERYSHSMGCNPHEIPKFEKLYPGSKYTPDGRLIIKNRQHKLQELKRRGYSELD